MSCSLKRAMMPSFAWKVGDSGQLCQPSRRKEFEPETDEIRRGRNVEGESRNPAKEVVPFSELEKEHHETQPDGNQQEQGGACSSVTRRWSKSMRVPINTMRKRLIAV